MERQVTDAARGHILTNIGCWSSDGQWLVYDTRSDAAGSKFDGVTIERVHVQTGRVQVLYESRNGANCGVATCCPVSDRIVFILGPERPTIDWQYAAYHRRGVILSMDNSTGNSGDSLGHPAIQSMDAMCYAPPFTPGALRGGSHVHTFDAQGRCVAFTYEDHVLATIDRQQHPHAEKNQRNIGISVPLAADRKSIEVPTTHQRNHAGSHFSVLVSETVDQPEPGSDQIDRAYEDAWLGQPGSDQKTSCEGRALAFLGDVVGQRGQRLTELFKLELPGDLTRPGHNGPLEGTATTRPRAPLGVLQQRLTFTEEYPQPGVSGPRHWPRSTPDGAWIFFLMRDAQRVPQLWRISRQGGSPIALTRHAIGIQSAFSVSSDGQWIAYVADGSVWKSRVDGTEHRRLTEPDQSSQAPRPEACVFSPDGSRIAYVRRLESGGRETNQIFICERIFD